MAPLPQAFFSRATLAVARDLLGQRLVRLLNGQRLSGLIAETEAYLGPDDPASHAYHFTPRSAIMYGPAGHAYVYFIYGRNFCLNVVTEAEGHAGAVLLRGIVPEEGLTEMRARRGLTSVVPALRSPLRLVADGPGKLCQALGIDRALNGVDLAQPGELYVESGVSVPDRDVHVTPRIGIRGDAETQGRPWRFVWRPS